MSDNVNVRHSTQFLAFSYMFVALNAQAQDSGVVEGPFSLKSGLRLGLRDDDNIFRAPASEREPRITVLSAALQARSEHSRHRFEFEANGEYALYEENGDTAGLISDFDQPSMQYGANMGFVIAKTISNNQQNYSK